MRIWLSPIHPSPNRDWGYDVSDYDGSIPTTARCRFRPAAVGGACPRPEGHHGRGAGAHLRRARLVPREPHGRDKADWYVWAPPREDGTPPNNWLSAFAGEAWAYHPARREILPPQIPAPAAQAQLAQPEAREAALAVLDRWLERGVDGFRLDVANAYLHDPALTDNPPVPMAEADGTNWAHAPNLQYPLYDSNLVENIEALDEIRRTVDCLSRIASSWASSRKSRSAAAPSRRPDAGLHSGYSFPLLQRA